MFFGKKILVLGFGKSGEAAIKLLLSYQADITLSEKREIKRNEKNEWLFNSGVIIKDGAEGQAPGLFEEGWDFVVKSPGIPYRDWYLLRLRERGIPVISEIELGYMAAPNHKYIAITGTNGKTTTTELTYRIISGAHPESTYVAGNIGIPLCGVILENNLTERGGCYIVLEVSNFQLMDINTFRPSIATIINLAPDHMNEIGSLEEYYASKTNVYKNMSPSDTFILNTDDKIIKEYISKYPLRAGLLTFSLSEENDKTDCYLKNNRLVFKGEAVFDISKTNIVAQNILTAFSIARAAGIGTGGIIKATRDFKGVEHRLEFVRELNGVRYYNDSKATNVAAAETALTAIEGPVILLIGGEEKKLDVSPLQKYFYKIKSIIGYGECGYRLVNDLAHKNSRIVNSLKEAVEAAHSTASAGDTVLLSPTTSSFDQFKDFEERGNCFKELVKALL